MRATVEINEEEVILFLMYRPSGVIAPIEGRCSTYFETYGYFPFYYYHSILSVFDHLQTNNKIIMNYHNHYHNIRWRE